MDHHLHHSAPLPLRQVWNHTGLFRARRLLVAEGELRVGAIPSATPTFAWLPLWKPKAERVKEAGAARKEAASAGLRTVTAPSPFGPDGIAGAVQVCGKPQPVYCSTMKLSRVLCWEVKVTQSSIRVLRSFCI